MPELLEFQSPLRRAASSNHDILNDVSEIHEPLITPKSQASPAKASQKPAEKIQPKFVDAKETADVKEDPIITKWRSLILKEIEIADTVDAKEVTESTDAKESISKAAANIMNDLYNSSALYKEFKEGKTAVKTAVKAVKKIAVKTEDVTKDVAKDVAKEAVKEVTKAATKESTPPSAMKKTPNKPVIKTAPKILVAHDSTSTINNSVKKNLQNLQTKEYRKFNRPSLSEDTLMIQNVPRSVTAVQLKESLHSRGWKGAFNYVYLPSRFATKCPAWEQNMGFAFINFRRGIDGRKFVRT